MLFLLLKMSYHSYGMKDIVIMTMIIIKVMTIIMKNVTILSI